MATVVVVISSDSDREHVVKTLTKSGFTVISRAYVPDIIDFLNKEIPDVAVIDADYFEKFDTNIREKIVKTNLLGWTGKYDPPRSVNLINLGALDVLYGSAPAAEVAGVVGHHCGDTIIQMKMTLVPASNIWGRFKYYLIGLGAVLVLALSGYLALRKSREPKQTIYNVMTENPTGITVAKGKIWISDWFTQSIYAFDVDRSGTDLLLSRSFYLSDYAPSFLNIIDNYVWVGSSDGTIRKYDFSGDALTLVEKIPAPGYSPSGLCKAGDFMYSTDAQTGKIYQHIIMPGLPLLNTYNYPGLSPIGIQYNGKYFYTADIKANRIYKHLGPQNQFMIVGNYALTPASDGEIAGIYKDDKSIYIVFASKPSKLFVYPLKNLR